MGCNFYLSDIDFHGYATKKDEVNMSDERLA